MITVRCRQKSATRFFSAAATGPQAWRLRHTVCFVDDEWFLILSTIFYYLYFHISISFLLPKYVNGGNWDIHTQTSQAAQRNAIDHASNNIKAAGGRPPRYAYTADQRRWRQVTTNHRTLTRALTVHLRWSAVFRHRAWCCGSLQAETAFVVLNFSTLFSRLMTRKVRDDKYDLNQFKTDPWTVSSVDDESAAWTPPVVHVVHGGSV